MGPGFRSWVSNMTDTSDQMGSSGAVEDQGDAQLDALMAATGDRMLAAISRCLDLDAGMAEIISNTRTEGVEASLPPTATSRKSGSANRAQAMAARIPAAATRIRAAAADSRDRRQALIVLPGLLLTVMLAMLDNLIVSTAMPRIVGDLGGVTHLSWVVTAYILASAITTPFYGKLGDKYGRKKFFIAAIVIFLAASALTGLSQSMAELITFRTVQGLGAGGLMVGAMATLGDITAPRERDRYMSYMMVVMMLATIGGPLLGGFITTNFSWRWIFYINLPIGGVALIYLIATLHPPAKKVSHKIDYLGGALLAMAATALILLTAWAGTEYSWGSAQIIGLGLLAAAATVAFCVTETRAAEPMLPLHVFRNMNFSILAALAFLTGLAMFGAMTFLPLYQQMVQRESPTVSGLMLTPMMLGLATTSIVAGRVTKRTGQYKIFPFLGGAIMAVALVLLFTTLNIGTPRMALTIYSAILGLGLGFLMEMVSLIGQIGGRKDLGAASSARMFFPQIGGALGVAAFGAVFTQRLTHILGVAARLGIHISVSGGQLNPATVNSLPAALRHDVAVAITYAVRGVFAWATLVALLIFVLAFVLALLFGERSLSGTPSSDGLPEASAAAEETSST